MRCVINIEGYIKLKFGNKDIMPYILIYDKHVLIVNEYGNIVPVDKELCEFI